MTDADTTDTAPTPPDQLGYAGALAELEAILAGLEDTDVDVDVLGQRVERAAVLLRFCRARIHAARTEVERVVADLDDGQTALDIGPS